MIPLLVLFAAGAVHERYDAVEAQRAPKMLVEAIRFATVAGNTTVHQAQKEWILKTAAALDLVGRDAGPVTEVELPGPPGSPVLGLVVHGDVQPVEESSWKVPAWAGVIKGGAVWGRGAADDKGPLVQALLALSALKAAGPPRTHTVRLLVGSDEESENLDMRKYLAEHSAPDLTLVLDSAFPAVVGEKAWDALTVTADPGERPRGAGVARREGMQARASETKAWSVALVQAGISASIVPDWARLILRWREGEPRWSELVARLSARTPSPGTKLRTVPHGAELEIVVRGRAAHSGVNLELGRNALVALARAVEGELPEGSVDDLLAFARLAGEDLHGVSLGLPQGVWDGFSVNVATIDTQTPLAPREVGKQTLVVNVRRPPPLTAAEMRAKLEAVVRDFAKKRGANLRVGGFFEDEPLVFDPQAKVVRHLMAAYTRVTGRNDPPSISGGGTYAKRIPRAIAFGMWFPGKPYPGHDNDEHVPIEDLKVGAHVLLEALVDLACGPPLPDPFAP
ncbi:MAG: M20/M25/M40 family metallo-hydrolase [Myxococcales bacterium]